MTSIHIHELGPVRDVNIDLSKDINLIIGPQATGKSTVGKIVYFCKRIRSYLVEFLKEDDIFLGVSENEMYISFLKYIRKKYMESFGTTKHMSKEFTVEYRYSENAMVTITLDEQKYVVFKFSPYVEKEIKIVLTATRRLYEDNADSDSDTYSSISRKLYLKRMLEYHFATNTQRIFGSDRDVIYIPAGRSLLSALSDQLDVVNTVGMDLPMSDFVRRIRNTKLRFGTKLDDVVDFYVKTINSKVCNEDIAEAKRLIGQILRAEYINDSDGEKLFIDDEHWVKLIYGSSGQQEALWIVLLLFIVILENKKTFFIVEEPEAHLYPAAQRSMMELLALAVNSSESQMFITTHSPYIMTSANLLLYSGIIEGNIEQSSDEIVVSKQFRLVPEQVSAYKFSEDKNGILYNIIDEETGLINTEEIDTISDVINKDTEKIIDLEIKYGM